MDRVAVCIDLIELAWEEGCTVQARIECAVLLLAASADLDAAKDFVPTVARCRLDFIKLAAFHLGQVSPGLLK